MSRPWPPAAWPEQQAPAPSETAILRLILKENLQTAREGMSILRNCPGAARSAAPAL
jgi:hypothetical protein